MKIVINIIACFAFIAQFGVFAFSALNQKKPESVIEMLHSNFVLVAYLCSLLTVVIFVIQYNFNSKMLKKKFLNCIFLVIVLLGIYIHAEQLMTQKDLRLVSSILLLLDFSCIRKIMHWLFPKSGEESKKETREENIITDFNDNSI